MTLFLYDLLRPIAFLIFRSTVLLLKIVGSESGAKLIQTLEIRKINGRPAFEAIDVEKFHGKRPVWIHAASGEFEYAKPVVRRLHDLGIPVFVTFFSPTYKANVESFPGVSASCALPLESRSELQSMIGKIKPAALLIARTDTWPNMVRESYAAKIPVLLFSATFYEGSKRIGFFARSLTKATYGYIEEIQCVNKADLELLSKLGYRRAVVRGDTRYDQVLARLDQSKLTLGKKLPDVIGRSLHDLILIAGSVWDEDVQALIPAIELAKKTLGPNEFSCVVVPHEISPRLIQSIKTLADSFGLTASVLSELTDTHIQKQRFDIFIIDRVGILAELYQIGQFAFVGGSFRKTVHSVMEPLAAGCLTFVGPLHRNNREAIEFQAEIATHEWTSVTASSSADQFRLTLSRSLEKFKNLNLAEHEVIRARIQEQVRVRGKATDAVIDWVNRVRS